MTRAMQLREKYCTQLEGLDLDGKPETLTITPYCYTVELLVDQPKTDGPDWDPSRPNGGRAKVSFDVYELDMVIAALQKARALVITSMAEEFSQR